jgi:phosphate transport system substrate-binding protein
VSGIACIVPALGLRSQALTLALLLFSAACGQRATPESQDPTTNVIQNAGSDTMVNLAQAWAEEYATLEPSVSVEVSGGGSGTGIASLINGTVDLVNSSRKIEPDEAARAAAAGGEPQEYIVGFDALAVYVHRNNPLEETSLEQLADIYGERGSTTSWTQLGIHTPMCQDNEIILVSRQSNSGTFHYFREALLGEREDMRLGTIDLHGSKDVVEIVGRTPCALGYSGMGYATRDVKMLRVSRKTGEPTYAPDVQNTLSGAYPIARPLYLYTHGKPKENTRKYIRWVLSDAGQKIVEETGYVPIPEKKRSGQD